MADQGATRVVVVTGAAGGIGSVIAKALVASGAAVVVNDLGVPLEGGDPSPAPAEQLVAEIRAQGGDAVAHTGDVTDFDAARALIALAVETFGRLDGLVTCHGIFREGSVFDITPGDWTAIVQNHLTGTFTCLQAALRQLRAQGSGGSAVCVGSSSGYDGNPVMAHYAASKAGVAALVKSAALAAGGDDINVNVVIPNAVTRVTTRPSSISGTWWKGDAPTAELGAMLTLALLDPACRRITGQVFMTSGDRLTRWSQPAEDRAERRSSWTQADVVASLTGFMDGPPLRRFAVYGYPMPGSGRVDQSPPSASASQ